MPGHDTTVEIDAAPEVVWEVTADVGGWPRWSPTMTSVERADDGAIRPGSTARVRQPGLSAAVWTVDEADPAGAFVWHTGGIGYVVTAVHRGHPTPRGTEVYLSVQMTGPLSGLLWRLMGRTIRGFVEQEAAALKTECERRAA